jgi:proline iminopeptidase
MRLLIAFVLLHFVLAFDCNAQQEFFAPADGVRIAYRSFGSGTPILLINGGPGLNSEGFEGLAKMLSTNNRVIIYDQRGTGHSQLARKDASTITMRLMDDDIERLRVHLGYKDWIVMGHSFGGMLASFYTTQHPEKVKALVLSSSGGIDMELFSGAGNIIYRQLSEPDADSLRFWESRISDGDTSGYARRKRAHFLAFAYVYFKRNAGAIEERLQLTDRNVNSLVWQDLRRIRFNCAPLLASFTKPALIIQGRQDIVDSSAAKKAHHVLKNSQLVLLDQCRHYGWLDQPEKYFAALRPFLAQVSG